MESFKFSWFTLAAVGKGNESVMKNYLERILQNGVECKPKKDSMES